MATKFTGAIILTGGLDGAGRPLVTFVPTHHALLSGTTEEIVTEIRELLPFIPSNYAGYGFLVNFRAYTKEAMLAVLEALDQLQTQSPGQVGMLYAVMPKSKDLQKTLKKQLGLKLSRTNPRLQKYQSVLVNDTKELSKYLDVSQLTADFDGTMPYSIPAWTTFMKQHVELVQNVEIVAGRVPSGLDKLLMMVEYEIPATPDECTQLIISIRQKYNDVMRDINLEHTIDECKEYVGRLKVGRNFLDTIPPALLKTASRAVEEKMQKLIGQRQELKDVWQQAEGRVTKKAKVQKYKAKSDKILQWIKDVGMPGVNEDPEIADCLSKAEIFKTHFETGFYKVSKDVLWLSRKLHKKLEDLLLENHNHIPELMKYSRNFEATTDYFKKAVDKKYRVYANVYNFYLTSQKMTQWYQRTLRFLPVQLLHQEQVVDSRTGRPLAVIRPTKAWRSAVDDFVLRHPMPKLSHLTKLSNVVPVIDNMHIRKRTQHLIFRIERICKLLANTDGTAVGVIVEMLRWRNLVQEGADDISLNTATTSTVDLSSASMPQFQYACPSISLGSISHLSHASSTKSLSGARFALQNISYDDVDGDDEVVTDGGQQYLHHSMDRRRSRSPVKKTAHFRDQSLPRNKSDASGLTVAMPRVSLISKPAALDRSNKLKSRSEHNISLIADAHDPTVRPKRFEKKQSPVPRLDLSSLQVKTKRAVATKEKLQKGPKNAHAYGIHGDSDTEDDVREDDVRENDVREDDIREDDVREDDDIREKPSYERYVSLDIQESSQLVHKDVSTEESQLFQRLFRRDSVTDSGITHTQTGTDASALSLNTLGLSPPIAMDVTTNGFDDSLQTPAKDSSSQMLESASLPNLNYRPNRGLSLPSESNIDVIANSTLPEEEKIHLMASLGAGTDLESSNLADIIHDLPYRLLSTPERKLLTPSPKNAENSVEKLKLPPKYTSTPMVKPTKDTLNTSVDSSHSRVKKPSLELTPSKVPHEPHSTAKQSKRGSEPSSQSSHDDQSYTRKKKPEYGYDIQSWLDKNGHEAAEESVELGSVEINSNGGIEEFIEKLKSTHQERKADEDKLRKAREHYTDLQLEEEALCQENVEQSLKRTQKLIQEQEERMLSGSPQQEGSLHHPLGKPDLASRGDSMNVAENFDDCSASEESGVFTQTSSDSRLRFTDSGNELRLKMLQNDSVHRKAMPEKSILKNRISLESRMSSLDQPPLDAPTADRKSVVPEPKPRLRNSVALSNGTVEKPHAVSSISVVSKTGYNEEHLGEEDENGSEFGTESGSSTTHSQPDVRPKTSSSLQADFYDKLDMRMRARLNIPKQVNGSSSSSAKDTVVKPPRNGVYNGIDSDKRTEKPKLQIMTRDQQVVEEDNAHLKSNQSSSNNTPRNSQHHPVSENGKDNHTALDGTLSSNGGDGFGGGTLCSEDESIKITGLDSESEMIGADDCVESRKVSTCSETDQDVDVVPPLPTSPRPHYTRSYDVDLFENGDIDNESERMESCTTSNESEIKDGEQEHDDETGTEVSDIPESQTPQMEYLSEGEMYYESEDEKNESPQISTRDVALTDASEETEKTDDVNADASFSSTLPFTVLSKLKSESKREVNQPNGMVVPSKEEKKKEIVPADRSAQVETKPLNGKQTNGQISISSQSDEQPFHTDEKPPRYIKKSVEDKSPKRLSKYDLEHAAVKARHNSIAEVAAARPKTAYFPVDAAASTISEPYQERAIDVPSTPCTPNSLRRYKSLSQIGSMDANYSPLPKRSQSTCKKQPKKGLFRGFIKRFSRKKKNPIPLDISEPHEQPSGAIANEHNYKEEEENIPLHISEPHEQPLGAIENEHNYKEEENIPLDISEPHEQPLGAIANKHNYKEQGEKVEEKKEDDEEDKYKEEEERVEYNYKEAEKEEKKEDNEKVEEKKEVEEEDEEDKEDIEEEDKEEDEEEEDDEEDDDEPKEEEKKKDNKNDDKDKDEEMKYDEEDDEDDEDDEDKDEADDEDKDEADDKDKDEEMKYDEEDDEDDEDKDEADDEDKDEADGKDKDEEMKYDEEDDEDDEDDEDKDEEDDEDKDEANDEDKYEEMKDDEDEGEDEPEVSEEKKEYQGYEEREDDEAWDMSYRNQTGSDRYSDSLVPPLSSCFTLEDLKTPIIIDNGSGMCKCGLATDETPIEFPNIIGRPKYTQAIQTDYQSVYVGDNTRQHQGMLKLSHPIEHGIIQNQDDMERLWSHTFENKLRVDPAEHPVLMTDVPLNSKEQREWMTQVMFENYCVPAFNVSNQALLALYGTNKVTGLLLNIGDGVTNIVPVYECYCLPHATETINLAGRNLTEYMVKLLQEQGTNLSTSAEAVTAREMKEAYCYVAENFNDEDEKARTGMHKEIFHPLSDGNIVSVYSERFSCPEVLFNSSLVGMKHGGIHNAVYQSINKCDKDLHEELLANIVLSGGTTMLPGFASRLQTELMQLFPRSTVKVIAPENRTHLTWHGGATVASLSTFSSSWLSRQDYDEYGSNIVHRKCF